MLFFKFFVVYKKLCGGIKEIIYYVYVVWYVEGAIFTVSSFAF